MALQLIVHGQGFLNKRAYKARMRLSVEAFLLEANDRASASGQRAYCAVAGLGLGVWRVDDAQWGLFIGLFADCVRITRWSHTTTPSMPPHSRPDWRALGVLPLCSLFFRFASSICRTLLT